MTTLLRAYIPEVVALLSSALLVAVMANAIWTSHAVHEVMDAALKQKWIDALRSGKYKQGIGDLRVALHGHYEFCCLGVLADVAGADWRNGMLGACEVGAKDEAYLSPDVETLVGISYETQKTLAQMNDSDVGFGEIADYIEANL